MLNLKMKRKGVVDANGGPKNKYLRENLRLYFVCSIRKKIITIILVKIEITLIQTITKCIRQKTYLSCSGL